MQNEPTPIRELAEEIVGIVTNELENDGYVPTVVAVRALLETHLREWLGEMENENHLHEWEEPPAAYRNELRTQVLERAGVKENTQ